MSYGQDLNRINCSILHNVPLSPILFLNEASRDWRAPSKWGACHPSSRSGAKSPARGPWEPFWWGLRQQQAHRPPRPSCAPGGEGKQRGKGAPSKPQRCRRRSVGVLPRTRALEGEADECTRPETPHWPGLPCSCRHITAATKSPSLCAQLSPQTCWHLWAAEQSSRARSLN